MKPTTKTSLAELTPAELRSELGHAGHRRSRFTKDQIHQEYEARKKSDLETEAAAEVQKEEDDAENKRLARDRRESEKAAALKHFDAKHLHAGECDFFIDGLATAYKAMIAEDIAGRRCAEEAIGDSLRAPDSLLVLPDAMLNRMATVGLPVQRGLIDLKGPTVAQACEGASQNVLGEIRLRTPK